MRKQKGVTVRASAMVVRAMVEGLETRRMLSVSGASTISGPITITGGAATTISVTDATQIALSHPLPITSRGTVSIQGTPGKDAVNVFLDQKGMLVVRVNSNLMATASTGIRGFNINTGDGDDNISIVLPATTRWSHLHTTIYGGAGNDSITTSSGIDRIYAGDGNDTIQTGAGNDKIYGDAGNDSIDAGNGNDFCVGGDGDDNIDGFNGNDNIAGNGGKDTLLGGNNNDLIDGGGAADSIDAGSGNDRCAGGDGSDVINGGDGNDWIWGQAGNNKLLGGRGDDDLFSSTTTDALTGGPGNDDFYPHETDDENAADHENMDFSKDDQGHNSNSTDAPWNHSTAYPAIVSTGRGVILDGSGTTGVTTVNAGSLDLTGGTAVQAGTTGSGNLTVVGSNTYLGSTTVAGSSLVLTSGTTGDTNLDGVIDASDTPITTPG